LAAQTVSLVGPASRNGAGNVVLSGATVPGKTVKLYAKKAGSTDPYVLLSTAVADPDTWWTKTVSVTRSMTFIASINSDDIYSDALTVTVRSTVSVTAAARGNRVVRLTIAGNPRVASGATIWTKVGTSWRAVKTVRTNSSGRATVDVRALGTGTRYFKVVYQAPGTTAGTAITSLRGR